MAVTNDRFPYQTATEITQSFLDDCQANLTNDLQLVIDIERPDGGFIRASDRNKYVGGTFYEALCNFPVISRTIGDWLSGQIEFSDLAIEISNVDKRFNDILPAGDDYSSWIGLTVEVSIVLREVESSKIPIFTGFITEKGGIARSTKAILANPRDKFDSVNQNYPVVTFDDTTYPFIEDGLIGTGIPVIYGNWTTELQTPADVPAFVVNGTDPDMNGGPDGTDPRTENVQLVTSIVDLVSFDNTKVYLVRGDVYSLISDLDITNIGAGNKSFEVIQDSGNTQIPIPNTDPVEYENFLYESGDAFHFQCTGKDLGIYDDNIVWIARDLLITYGGLTAGDFDSSWATYRDKNAPAQSAIASIPARLWRSDQIPVVEEALSLLEEVRLEAFVSRELLFRITSLHFEDWDATPSFTLTNFDLERDTFKPMLDIRNNFNRALAEYNFVPAINANSLETNLWRNQAAIDDAKGKLISKRVIYPHLYQRTDVENQLIETIRIASGYIEHINVNCTWRSLLIDIGDIIAVNVDIESTVFENVPCLVREIGYDPDGLKIIFKLWSTQLLPFPGWAPPGSGITGGYNAVITEET
jgi:hypothetical protein